MQAEGCREVPRYYSATQCKSIFRFILGKAPGNTAIAELHVTNLSDIKANPPKPKSALNVCVDWMECTVG